MHSDEDPYPIEFDEFPGNVLSSKGFVEEDDYNNVEEEENDEDNDDDFEDADYDPVDLAGRKNRRLAGATGAKSKKVEQEWESSRKRGSHRGSDSLPTRKCYLSPPSPPQPTS